GRTTEATTLFKGVLADRERLLGRNHPATLTARDNLANSYAAMGRTTEATTLFKGVLADRERLLGRNHPATLTA
ncbi:tetratricopeptide repeat protein, partial [Streptomyces sp. NPDC060184]|uniref:tetratricopeptide repeat protein n=1 Tax=Streptomyces sp. NPDC060184 TaxID=3347064 RepID=UPI00364E4A86